MITDPRQGKEEECAMSFGEAVGRTVKERKGVAEAVEGKTGKIVL